MTPGPIYAQEPFNGILTPLHAQIAERRGIARLHNAVMEEKYGWSPDGYPNWHDDNGYNQEYPLPYSSRYFYRFIDLFFRRGAETGIIDSLEQEFIGDKADALYVEELFVRAEDCNLFTPGAAVALYADSQVAIIKLWLPGEEVSSRYANSFNTYYGSQANESRRELIRKWLELKAKENAQPVAETIPIGYEPAESEVSSSPTEDAIKSYLTGDKSILRCDSAALKIGLVVGGIAGIKSGKCRINALAYGLSNASKAGGDEEAFALALAKRYAVDYSGSYDRNHYPDSATPRINKKWESYAHNVMTEARNWISKQEPKNS